MVLARKFSFVSFSKEGVLPRGTREDVSYKNRRICKVLSEPGATPGISAATFRGRRFFLAGPERRGPADPLAAAAMYDDFFLLPM